MTNVELGTGIQGLTELTDAEARAVSGGWLQVLVGWWLANEAWGAISGWMDGTGGDYAEGFEAGRAAFPGGQ
jgi:hypothetical protein